MTQLVFGPTVTLVHRVLNGQDEFGNDVYTDQTEEIPFCSYHPGSTTEVWQGTEQVSIDVTVYFPDGTEIKATDAFIINGEQYEIEGRPEQWSSPFTAVRSPIQVYGRLVTGASV